MRTIAIINQKGGCGKTTTAINLAACMARLGQRTLLVDMDPQGHCATGLAVPEDQIQRTVFDTLVEPQDLGGARQPARIPEITWQIATGFDLAPANLKLAAFEQIFAGREGREKRLAAALDVVDDNYAWAIIDCPPGVGLLTFNALFACDEVVIPVETGYFSLHGLARMIETLEELKDRCGKDILMRVLPTLYDTRTKLAREVLAELRGKFRDVLMRSCVNFNSKLREAASFGQPISEYDPGSRGYKDFVNLARELMGERPLAVDAGSPQHPGLSRSAELVQRARQLAQLSAAKFGRGGNLQPPAGQILGEGTFPALARGEHGSEAVDAPPRHTPRQAPAAAADGHDGTPRPAIPMRIQPQPLQPSPATPTPTTSTSPATAAPTPASPLGTVGPRFRIDNHASAPNAGRILKLVDHTAASATPTTADPTTAPSSPSAYTAAQQIPDRELQHQRTNARIDAIYGVRQDDGDVLFRARFDGARRVLVAGDFNGWDALGTPLHPDEQTPGAWAARLPLPAGRYRYRFIVDGRWANDPHNHRIELNEYGEFNNVVEVC